MNSRVLFMETSLRGFFGSGDNANAAVESMSTQAHQEPAGQLDVVLQAELVAERHDVVVAVAVTAD
jgi:hypothetical protein